VIFVRIFIDRIPDSWEPAVVWYLAALETLIEVFLISLVWWMIKYG
jgi:hypothetical protein